MSCSSLRSRDSRNSDTVANFAKRPLRMEQLEPRLVLSGASAVQSIADSSLTSLLGVVADSYINSSKANTNYGRSSDLMVQNQTGKSEAYLKYDISGISGAITKATLNLHVLSSKITSSAVVITVRLLADKNDGWIEGEKGDKNPITWKNSQDAVGTTLTISLTKVQLSKSSTVSIDVTSLLNQKINTNGIASFVVAMASTSKKGTVDFASGENVTTAHRPTLSVTSYIPGSIPTVEQAARITASTSTTVSLSVLGEDADNEESELTYTWSLQSPTNLKEDQLPEYSSNGTNDAKNVVVTFKQAGAYVFTVKISDPKGHFVSGGTVKVTVGQELADLSLTPAELKLFTGTTQQFILSGVDQFGNSMALSNVTWSATCESIPCGTLSGNTASSTVTYTAPNFAADVVLTAQVGSVSTSASVSVTAPNFLNLLDDGLANLTQSLFADGSINRLDMITIFNTITDEDDITVDATDIKDLKTILSNATTLCIPDYVLVLANDVVYGNAANAHYLGNVLGNLKADVPNSKLENLVNKWFFGTDLPDIDYDYATTAGSLYGSDGIPLYTDAQQGAIGDCYFLSGICGVAKNYESIVVSMFIDNGDDTWTVRFYANGAADYVTVNRELPYYQAYGMKFLVAQGMGNLVDDSSNVLWLALAEKAYAQWNETGKTGRDLALNSYNAIEGGFTGDVFDVVMNTTSTTYSMVYANKQKLIDALSKGKAVGMHTLYSDETTQLVGLHAYNVISYDSSTCLFTLYNPWGSDQPNPVTYGQMMKICSGFSVSGNTKLATSSSTSWSLIAPLASALSNAPMELSSESSSMAENGTQTVTLSAIVDDTETALPTASVDALFEDRDTLFGSRSSSADVSLNWLDDCLFDSRISFNSIDGSFTEHLYELDVVTRFSHRLLNGVV